MNTTRNPDAIPYRPALVARSGPMQDVAATLVIKMGLAGLILFAFLVGGLGCTIALANWRTTAVAANSILQVISLVDMVMCTVVAVQAIRTERHQLIIPACTFFAVGAIVLIANPVSEGEILLPAWALLRWALVLGVLAAALALVRMAWADVQHEIERWAGRDLDGDGDVGGVVPEPRLIYVKGTTDDNALPEPTAADLACFVKAIVEARDWTCETWHRPGALALPSGRRLSRPYYESLMDVLQSANIITGRERRKTGYLNVEDADEAIALLGVGED